MPPDQLAAGAAVLGHLSYEAAAAAASLSQEENRLKSKEVSCASE